MPKEEEAIDPFAAEEQAAILEALPPDGRPVIQFAFWTGLRTSELVALEWDDIDWKGKRFKVTRAITQASPKPPRSSPALVPSTCRPAPSRH
ncbi:hypothetical protein EKK97_22190 [Billgrantia tianxiuensis]|uniref:Tyr recombinase domain-containing protein n=1 Tax=Billgrantia tianxiuensis TaxID=2497861 RepID=A0A6I6SS61_9GAMM|nr:tyrosine-type recombinase/integrase [Halomonas sp. MCCC 1A11057]MCE8035906.1 tyrosine-type recombinase/integrase [Halomonas sp. MCCC 1A11057]QHC52251.1 hypothetical protein EKK97_22190 [Halomonas tianxiuensis]